MGTCESRTSQIERLLDGELTPGEEAELRKHVGDCPHCAKMMNELARTKSLLEERLAANIILPEDDIIVRRTKKARSAVRTRSVLRGFLKKAAIAAAAGIAAIAISGYLFVHFYFGRTFSYQLSETVMRCSDGIERKVPGAEWELVHVGDPLDSATLIRTPQTGRSFMSFDGIRLLTEGEATFELREERVLSFKKGEMVIASAERETPVDVAMGGASVRTNGGVLRIERADNDSCLGVALGTAELTLPDGTTHKLAENQTATFGKEGSDFKVASHQVIDPFARMKVSALDRAKERFARMLATHFPDHQMAQHAIRRFGGPGILDMWNRPRNMYQFASFSPDPLYSLAQADTAALGEYYENLFVPSNRWITVGRQRLVPPVEKKRAAYPIWSHDGSMIAYTENIPAPAILKVVRLDDIGNPWTISQNDETVLPFFPVAWTPDDRHIFYLAGKYFDKRKGWGGPYTIKIAPVDPAEGPLREFKSPFRDIQLPIKLQAPLGKTIAPHTLKLPWGDAMLCVNWGNIAYIPIEPDGQAVEGAPGLFLTDFNQTRVFVAAAVWSPSGSMITFLAVENRDVSNTNVYILYDVEDILDGFALPPRDIHDPRIKEIAPSPNDQIPGGFSFDESLVFFQEDVNGIWRALYPWDFNGCDFDLFYANALPGEPGMPTQIHLPDSQVGLKPSPEGNRIAYCNYHMGEPGSKDYVYELRVVSFDIEADIDVDLGGVLIDNSGTNLIVPPGALEENFGITISTPFSMGEEAEFVEGEETFFAMRLIDAKGLEKPKFIEPMTLTIRYTNDEVEGLDEWALDIYYYDESDALLPRWVPLGATVDPENNEITVEIQHFSKFAVGGKNPAEEARRVPAIPPDAVSIREKTPLQIAQVSSASSRPEADKEIRKALRQPVAFEFECEPLRDVLEFLTTITGVKIIVDEDVFAKFGKYEDCNGVRTNQKEIYVSICVMEIPLETALNAILKQYGMGFIIEGDHLYISERHNLPGPITQVLSPDELENAKGKVREALMQPVGSLQFEREPLRPVLSFISSITTGINIVVDGDIYEQFGETEGRYGKQLERKEIFVSLYVNELPVGTLLEGMLRQYGLGFSIEPGYIYISARDRLPESSPQFLSPEIQAAAKDALQQKLSKLVALEFECQSLREILGFLSLVVEDINIVADENIFKQFGKYEDCYGNFMERRDVFITVDVIEVSLESTLNEMLEPHGLKYSVEPGYVYVTVQDELESFAYRRESGEQTAVEAEIEIGKPVWSSADGSSRSKQLEDAVAPDTPAAEYTKVEWPEIEVKSIFDATNSGNYIAILEIDGRREFLKNSGRFEKNFEIVWIDGESKCITIAKHGPGDLLEERKFCREQE